MQLLAELQRLASGIGKWRYFLTGLPFAVLIWQICRTAGKLLAPFGIWRTFRGTCTAIEKANADHILTVSFQDEKHLHHTAAFRSRHASAAALQPDAPVTIAVKTDVFQAGSYAQTPDHAAENDGAILLQAEHRVWLLRTLLRIFLRGLLGCALAFAVFIFAMYVCFP